jgi:hypothetical protein
MVAPVVGLSAIVALPLDVNTRIPRSPNKAWQNDDRSFAIRDHKHSRVRGIRRLVRWQSLKRSRNISGPTKETVIARDLPEGAYHPQRHCIDPIWPHVRGRSNTKNSLRVIEKKEFAEGEPSAPAIGICSNDPRFLRVQIMDIDSASVRPMGANKRDGLWRRDVAECAN